MLAAPLSLGAFTEDTPRGLPDVPPGYALITDENGHYLVDDDGAFLLQALV